MATKTSEAYAARKAVLQTLRAAAVTLDDALPGAAAIEFPLDKILVFEGADGTRRAVIHVREIVYLADDILRRAAQKGVSTNG